MARTCGFLRVFLVVCICSQDLPTRVAALGDDLEKIFFAGIMDEHQVLTRLSFKECSVDSQHRQDCGYNGITEMDCHRRGCCYVTSGESSTPMCYYSNDMVSEMCMLDLPERQECGFPGIRKEQCLAQGCCYQPRNEHNVPWCYSQAGSEIDDDTSCGLTPIPPNIHGRVIAGEEARPHSWPWQVSLYLPSSDLHFCGGSVINNEWILTASHCVDGNSPSALIIRAGLHNRTGMKDEFYQESEVSQLIVHEGFSWYTLDNDVALVKLSTPLTYSDAVMPICLPDDGDVFEENMRSYVTGWGVIDYNSYESPETLQQALVPIVGHETCAEWMRDVSEMYGIEVVDETMVCVGFEEGGRAVCDGDSGGPLVVQRNNRWVQVGVASWTWKPCGNEARASVYARVSAFRGWIEEQVAANS